MRQRTYLAAMLAAGIFSNVAVAFAQDNVKEPIIIGAHLDLAKQASYYSLIQKGAAEVFLKELNATGGINGRPVKILFEDDELDPTVASRKVEKLASEGAAFILSISGSATGVAAQAKAEELQIPVGSPANTAERLTTNPPKKWYFRFSMRDRAAARALALYIKHHNSSAKVAVVRDATESGILISDGYIVELKQAGIEVVTIEQINPGAADVTAQALRVKQSNPDFVVVSGASIPDLANYVKMHATLGNRAQLLGSYVFGVPSFIKLAGAGAEGFIFTDTVDFTRPEVAKIQDIMVKALGEKAKGDASDIQVWEFLRFLTDAMKRGGMAHASLRDALEGTTNWPTALGQRGTAVNFSPERHDLFSSGEEVVLRQISNGAFHTLETH
jgi:branched-chain amino acid transport system substrate-binding protein